MAEAIVSDFDVKFTFERLPRFRTGESPPVFGNVVENLHKPAAHVRVDTRRGRQMVVTYRDVEMHDFS